MVRLSNLVATSFYDLHDDLLHKKHSNYWLKGGRGSTKSSFISIEIILGLMLDKDANAVVIRKVASTLRESVYDQYLWAVDKLQVADLWQASVSPLKLVYKPTGQEIRFKGADKPEKIKSQKFRHGYTKFKHYEEVTEFKSHEEIRSINQSLNRGGDDIITLYSYNPPASVNSWVNVTTEHEKFRKDTIVNESTYLTVPKDWLGKEFIADAEQLKKDNLKAYEHEFLGKVTGTGAEVFSNVIQRRITDDEVRSFDRLYRGLDFGFASDPLAYIEVYFDKTRRTLYFVNEIFQVSLSNKEAVEKIKKLNNNHEYITSDREPRTVAEFRSLGLNITPAKKGPDSRRQGFKWLQDLRAIVVDETRTPNAAMELTSYELERDANGNLKAEYPDGNDHTLDSTRYAVESLSKKGGFVGWK